MVQFDPKLLKKISPSKLTAAATEVGIKNAEKVSSKEQLIKAFLDAVEKADVDGNKAVLTPNVVNMYNEVIIGLELDKEPPPEESALALEAAPIVPATPVPTPAPQVAHRAGRGTPAGSPTPAPPAASAPAPASAVGEKKEKEAKTPRPKRYTRIDAMHDALVEMKGGGKLEALYSRASQLYISHGGTDKIVEAEFFCGIGLTGAKAVGAVVITETDFVVK